MAENTSIFAIIGPTASGKSALAMALAKHLRGEILCVDSMTVYRGMDLGTAKPTIDDQSAIPHHLLDVSQPNETFDVNKFVALADAVIADAASRNKPLIAVGGTPMYFKALFDGLFEGPGADEQIRNRLRSIDSHLLHDRLRAIDPVAADRIHSNDQRRLIRALEVYELTGRPISTLQTHWDDTSPVRHPARWIGLAWDRDQLSRRINARVKQMFAAGWPDEVRQLLERHGNLSQTATEAAGYAALVDHVRGKISLDDAIEQTKIATRQLSRRQSKWFRRFRNVQWLPGDRPVYHQMQSIITADAPNNT